MMVNVVTASEFLIVFLVSGALTECEHSNVNVFITSPQKMEALSGSCLRIPCNFRASTEDEFDNTRETFGLWYKGEDVGDLTVVFNSSGSVLKYPISITGNLREKNCTTLFSNMKTTFTGTYYFRIMNWPYRATAVCDPLQITVNDSAPSPRIKISGDMKEGETVTVTCSALTPCPRLPPKLTWSLQKNSHNYMEEKTDGSFTTKIQENITLTDQNDGNNITCSVTYPVNRGEEGKTSEETMMLSVLYAPKNTSVSISPSGLVSAGAKVNLSCSSRAKPPVSSFTWFKISNNRKHINVFEGEFYSFNVTDDGVYYCEARNNVGNQTSQRINLEVKSEGHTNTSLKWQAALGGILGVIVFICVVVFIWGLRFKGRTSPQTQQIQADEQMSPKEPETKNEEKEESIHYGEINFSALRQEPSSDSVMDREQQQDTVYAQVKGSETTNNQTLTAGSTGHIYENLQKNVEKETKRKN